MRYPKVSIIVLNYNGLRDTKKCITSILKTDYPNYSVIIVDNGSEKNEAAIIKKLFANKKIRCIRLAKNYGFSGGNNRIFKKLESKYIFLLNNDTEVKKNFLSELVKTMEKDTSIAVAQPKILWMKNKKYLDYAGACGGFIDIFGYPFTRGRIFYTQERDLGQYNSQVDIFWASGAAMFIRKNVLDKVGYFDERFFNYMEEIDLCYRIHQAGYRIICEPKSVIYHLGGATALRNETKKRFWEHRNNLLFVFKNFPLKNLLIILIPRLFLEVASIIHYLSIRKYNFAFAVIQSHLSILGLIPHVVAERINRPTKKPIEFNGLIYRRSIVFSYFILKNRTFTSNKNFL